MTFDWNFAMRLNPRVASIFSFILKLIVPMGVTSLSLFVISIGRDLNDLTPLDLKRTQQQLRPRNADWLNAISHFFTYFLILLWHRSPHLNVYDHNTRCLTFSLHPINIGTFPKSSNLKPELTSSSESSFEMTEGRSRKDGSLSKTPGWRI